MSDKTSNRKDADGRLAAAMKRALPALLALAPGAGMAGGSSVSSGVRQAGRRVERQAVANVYRLEAAPAAAADAFSAFGVAPLTVGDSDASVAPARSAQADAELRRFLTENGLLTPASESKPSQLSGHKRSHRPSSASFDMVVGGFAGKPQFSGVCQTDSLCTSDGGNVCSLTIATPISDPIQCPGPRPPSVVSIALNGAPISTATSITYTVAFDETALSVTSDDFQVTTVSGSATGTVSSVVLIPENPLGQPSVKDRRFTVTVSSLAGNGSIRLDLKANTNIVDSNPFTATGTGHVFGSAGPYGNGNAGFTAAFSAGTVHTVALNNAPTGAVAIAGTVTEDQTLTADTSALADADGLGAFSYQWRRGGVPIVGATAGTYVLGDADVGATISVVVSYIDGLGNPESVTSAATAAVANVNDLPTGGVTIAGVATEDQTLTANNTLADADGLGVLSHQWRRNGADIVGATASTYLLGDADVGATITVRISYTDNRGTAESATSAATAAVANINDAPTGGVTISGTATEDQTLTAVSTLADGDGLGVLSYQWRRDGVPVVGATASSYLLGDADVGAVMSVVVTYTDQQGTAEGPFVGGPTAPVANVNDLPTGSVTISGTATEDQTLTASNTLADVDGLGLISYQWNRGGAPIVGATASTYVLGDADVGATITVTASYTDGRGTPEAVTSAATAAVANINDLPTGGVTIAGVATEDQTLTANNTLADADGLGLLSHQWRRNGANIVGATASTYVLGDADVGATITVAVTYTDGNGTAEGPFVSAATAVVTNVNDIPTGGIGITGTVEEDQTLTATSTLADGDGLGVLSYQWRRDGVPVVGATASTYLLGDADVGAVMSVVVTYTDQQGTPEGPFLGGPTIPVVNVNEAPTGSVTISGSATEDQTLTASNTLADADGLGLIGYQWNRGGVPIVGATANTYVLGDADVGATITVTASYTDGQGTAEAVTSAATAAVANVNDVPTGGVTIAGIATEDQTLTANNTLADDDGLGVPAHQWRRNGVDIMGATASTYVLGDADVGATITVRISYTDGNGTAESATSAATVAVANINDAPTGGVTIAGIATEDQTLTANSTLADADGLGTLNYQWRRDGVNIIGANASAYLLGDADVGAVMSVVVNYTDQQATAEGPFVGGPTAAVANVNDAPTGAVTISGSPVVAQTITANSSLADADGLGVLSYQWNRDGLAIVGATATTYVVGPADIGRSLTVTASYTDVRGAAESVTSAAVVGLIGGNRLPTGAVVISGITTEEQTLSASQNLADEDGLGTLSYQWRRNGSAVPGASGSTYVLGDLDVGASISVVASYVDGRGTPESVGSASVGPVRPEGTALAFQKRVFFVNPASNLTQQSFLRFINRNAQAVDVELKAIDDDGQPAPLGDVTFTLGADRSLQVTSQDLELGNVGKGLSGRFGAGIGKWQIKVHSSAPIDAMSLIRTPDGFVTNLSDTVPKPAFGEYAVYFANPASNPIQQTFLRVVNRSKQSGSVTVSGIDENGAPAPGGDLTFTLDPLQAAQFTASDLELGNPAKGLAGALGDGTGKWWLTLSSPLSLEVMSLIRTPDGFLTSLSATAPGAATDIDADKLALVANPADVTQQETFIRIVNPSAQSGTVILSAIDDSGQRPTPPTAWFDIGPFQSKQFNATDLELGNAAKGLSGGFGDGVGRWQITVTSLLPLAVQNLVRTPDGFVTNLSERAPKPSFLISDVPMLNPGDNANQRSFLRLINRTNAAGSAIISAIDDAGQPALGGSIVVDLGGNVAVELSAIELEQGNPGSVQLGAFGKGTGKWRLTIESDVEVEAQALLETADGFITNTSQPVR